MSDQRLVYWIDKNGNPIKEGDGIVLHGGLYTCAPVSTDSFNVSNKLQGELVGSQSEDHPTDNIHAYTWVELFEAMGLNHDKVQKIADQMKSTSRHGDLFKDFGEIC